jgi:hypothetical protein
MQNRWRGLARTAIFAAAQEEVHDEVEARFEIHRVEVRLDLNRQR